MTVYSSEGGTLHARFEQQAILSPGAIAASCNGRHLSYSELNAKANQVAHFLRCNRVVPETLVAICTERSLDFLIAVLGVLKAGGAYLPIDPAFPSERMRFMIEDSCAHLLLTQRCLVGHLHKTTAQVICLDDPFSPVWINPSDNPTHVGTRDDLAYVIYTSGSTGLPKGVEISHGNVVRLFDSTHSLFNFCEHDTWSLFHSCAFDFSVWEMWGSLLYGGRLVVVPFNTSRSPIDFYRLLSDEGVTVLNQTPSAFRQLSAAEENSPLALPLSLRLIIFGGEALNTHWLEPWFDRHGDCKPGLINMYGITETTVHVTFWPLSKKDLTRSGLIGHAISDLSLHILDENLQPVPVGVPGEIFVGGAGVARGYLRRSELTAERFIPDPFSYEPDARLYRTGDRARRLVDGNHEYLGRLDAQVKIRGFRVELGEIEAALDQHPGVQSSAVVALNDATGQNRLWGFFVPGTGSAADPTDLKLFLTNRLPDHMIPAGFTRIESLPLTPNGKLDRAALPSLLPKFAGPLNERAMTSTEAQLLNICRELLHYPALRVDEDLLDSGFHSLAFAQLAWHIQQKFGVSPTFSDLFKQRTVAKIAALAEGAGSKGNPVSEPIAAAHKPLDAPLSFAQNRVWFLERFHPGSLAYNFQSLLRFHGLLDLGALQNALNVLVERHEILRTSFPQAEGHPYQRIHPFVPFVLRVEDVQPEEAEQQIAKIIRTPFDFERVPPVRWVVFRLRPDAHWLLHVEHHLLHDGWAYEVFLRELFTCYSAFLEGRRPDLPPLDIQFADFAIWQQQELAAGRWNQQLQYWAHRLAEAPPLAQLPADRSRPRVSFAGAQLRYPFTHQFYGQLQAAAAREGVTPFMWLHAAFQTFLHRYTGHEEIIVGSGVANRQFPNAQQLLGMVINTVALRVSFRGQPSFRELLSRVRVAILEALDNQNAPFDQVIRRVGPGTELFNTFFDTYDREYPAYQTEVLEVERRDTLNNGSCKFELVALVLPAQSTPAILLWEYSTDLFTEETASRMMHHFIALLAASIDHPELSVADLPILSGEEKQRIVSLGKGRDSAITADRRIDRIFAAVAAARPDTEALVYQDQRISYRQLDECANEVAQKLRGHNLQPRSIVAFRLPRGPQAICTMLAILRSDCAFLPIDPKLPELRQQQLLQLAGASLLVTTDDIIRLRSASVTNGPGAAAENAAYVLFTSGSTGVPKVVCVPHQAVIRLVCNVDYVRLAADTRFLQLAPLFFDACMLEIWGPLLNGGVVVFHPQDVPDCAELGRTIAKHAVTTAWLTASFFNQVIDTAPEVLRPLRELLTGGEALSVPHVARALTALPRTKLTNGYGPTEATTFTTTFEVPRDFDPRTQRVPIGRPLADTQVYVLDEQRQLLPIGVPGEIYIGGAGLALGYLGDEALTAERFVPDHISGHPGARLYRTGDRGRMLPDGNLDCIGRLDRQVKIRGYRIELGEIEDTVLRYPGVSAAIVVVAEKPRNEKRLVAYVVPGETAKPTVSELRAYLQDNLPEYMVPNNFVLLDALPLTPAGKVDSKALTGFERAECSEGPQGASAAETPLEEVLAGIWAQVLELNRIGVHENFFALGGHSLLAMRLVHEINSAFGVELPVRALFASPTVAGQAREIERLRTTARQETPAHYPLLVPLRPNGSKLPFFLVAGGFGGEDELIVYAGLTRYLDRQRPFYGLRIRGVDDLVEPHKTVEAMAAEHVAEIRRVQPRGPYLIGGSCLGGVVALEIAQQIFAQGEKVESLILVDSNYLTWSSLLRYRTWRVWHSQISPLVQGWRKSRAQFLSLLKQSILSLVSPSPEQQRGRKKVRIGLRYLQTVHRYRPRPYHGPITLILCEEGTRDLSGVWREVARAGLDVQYVSGDHFTHLRKYAANTAARLNACLEAARN